MADTCAGCGEPIIGRAPDAAYCTPVCRRRAKERRQYHRKQPTPSLFVPRIATCRQCGDTFEHWGRRGRLPFRCPACVAVDAAAKAIRRNTKASTERPLERRVPNPRRKPLRKAPKAFCNACGESFAPRDRRQRFCSKACRDRAKWFTRPVKQRQEKRRRQAERDRRRRRGEAQ